MEFQKSWYGTLPEGQYEIKYIGLSSDMLKVLIERLKQNLSDIEKGIIPE